MQPRLPGFAATPRTADAILLLSLWRLLPGRRIATIALVIGFFGSLALSISLTPGNPSAASFLLPTRAWEIFAGGLVNLMAAHRRPDDPPARWLEALGLGLVLGTAKQRRHTLARRPGRHPGARHRTRAHRRASDRCLDATRSALQALGNWSYSIYLWHWPLAVALIDLEIADGPLLVLAAMAISILLGWLSFT